MAGDESRLTSKKLPPGLRKLPTQKRSREKFNRIVKAARTVLQTTGRDEFTVTEVVALAKVPVGTFYQFFDGRIGILQYLWPDRRDVYLDSNPHT